MPFVFPRPARLALCALSAALLLTLAPRALANEGDPVNTPTITLDVSGMGSLELTTDLDDFNSTPFPGIYQLKQSSQYAGLWNGSTDLTLRDLIFNSDPTVYNNILITNNTLATQTYTVTVSLPTTLAAPSLLFGDITTQVLDHHANGATAAALPGDSIYSALIDGNVVRTMQDDFFAVVTPFTGVANALASFGPEANALPVNASIGIRLKFTLTAGDTIAILSRFDVQPIPEPATFSLLSLGLAALLRRSRR